MIWLFIFLLTGIMGLLSIIYIISRVRRFKFIERISRSSKIKSIIISSLITVTVIFIIFEVFGSINSIVITIHFFIILLITELIVFILKKINIKNLNKIFNSEKIYFTGIFTIVITVIILSKGWYNAHHVYITEYTCVSDKITEPLKIVQFTDSHLGTTFDGEGFKKHIDTINSLNPDIILFTGDYVDGSSRDEDIEIATKALSQLKSKYGTYFCFGNHDKNVYGEENKRNTKTSDLISMLEENNVIVLEDEVIKISDDYTVIGRRDLAEKDRLSINDLIERVDGSDFIIDLNHQPNDYANEEAAGVDLVLSGHTHGGQFFPINEAGVWLKENDKTYGYEKRGNTNFIVSSGISDWAIDFKTGCISEIVVINIVPE